MKRYMFFFRLFAHGHWKWECLVISPQANHYHSNQVLSLNTHISNAHGQPTLKMQFVLTLNNRWPHHCSIQRIPRWCGHLLFAHLRLCSAFCKVSSCTEDWGMWVCSCADVSIQNFCAHASIHVARLPHAFVLFALQPPWGVWSLYDRLH